MGKLIIKHTRHEWEVKEVGIVPNSEIEAKLGFRYSKLCDVSGCLVYYNGEDWKCIGAEESNG
jgi:hypothetical protein